MTTIDVSDAAAIALRLTAIRRQAEWLGSLLKADPPALSTKTGENQREAVQRRLDELMLERSDLMLFLPLAEQVPVELPVEVREAGVR